MPALKRNLYIEQGATFTLGFTWHRAGPLDAEGNPTPGDPYDLTNCVARMQIRKKQQDPVLLAGTSAGDNPRITLGGATGRIDVKFDDEDTDALVTKTAVYDLEIEMWDGTFEADGTTPRPGGGDTFRLLQGTVTVDPNVTQDADDPVLGA